MLDKPWILQVISLYVQCRRGQVFHWGWRTCLFAGAVAMFTLLEPQSPRFHFSKETWERCWNLEIPGGSRAEGRGAHCWAPASPHCWERFPLWWGVQTLAATDSCWHTPSSTWPAGCGTQYLCPKAAAALYGLRQRPAAQLFTQGRSWQSQVSPRAPVLLFSQDGLCQQVERPPRASPCHSQQPAVAPAKGCWKFLEGQKPRLSSRPFLTVRTSTEETGTWFVGRGEIPRCRWAFPVSQWFPPGSAKANDRVNAVLKCHLRLLAGMQKDARKQGFC